MFLGTHTPRLDEKGRLFLPAKFRDKLAGGLVITRGQERCLYVFAMADFERLAAEMNNTPVTNRAVRSYEDAKAQESFRFTAFFHSMLAQGVYLPMVAIERRVNTTTSGAHLVPDDHRGDQYIPALRNSLLARRLGVRVLSGLRGNVSIPKAGNSVTAGWVADAARAARARPTAGKATSSNGSNVQLVAVDQSHGAATGSSRSGHDRPRAMGSRMSGGDACAIVEPSTNSTIECTTDWGCTTTWMSCAGTPKSRCASISSSPLFMSVAELIVTTGPIDQVGCASASCGVAGLSSSLVRPRNGPPEAVRISRRTSVRPVTPRRDS